MKLKKTIYVLVLMSTIVSASSDQYYIKYKGIKLGEITNLSTLQDYYLDAKVTNFIAKLLLKKEHFIFYEGEKPNILNAKYRQDKNKIIFALYQAIKHKPKFQKYIINSHKNLTLSCYEKNCQYSFIKKGKLAGKGLIEFDQDGKFYKLTEEFANVVIARKR